MPHHDWSEEDFDWESLNKAVSFWYKYSKWSRASLHVKEKYGTMRMDFFQLGISEAFIHQLIWPNYMYHQYKCKFKVYIKPSKVGNYTLGGYYQDLCTYIDMKLTCILKAIGIERVLISYQRFVFNIFSIIAYYRFKHIKLEVFHEPYFDDLLYKWVKKLVKYEHQWIICE